MPGPDTPSSTAAVNASRWGDASDGTWRGYRRSASGLELEDRVKAALGLVVRASGAALLDIGCGDGVLTALFAGESDAGKVEGVDVVSLSPPFQCQVVDLDSDYPLPFPDRSFDVVVCLETLEHVHDTDHLVLEIRRVLNPSGYAILSVPRIDGFLTVGMLLLGYLPPAIECSVRRRYGSPQPCGRVSGHVSHFTRRSLLELMDASGFDVDAEAQAGIYSGWKLATPGRLPLLRALLLRFLASLRVKQDDLIVRVRPRSA